MQAEQAPLIAIHVCHRLLSRFVCPHLRVIGEYVPAHRIRIRFDDAGDDKQQRPKRGEDRNKQEQRKRRAVIFKAVEQLRCAHFLHSRHRQSHNRQSQRKGARQKQPRNSADIGEHQRAACAHNERIYERRDRHRSPFAAQLFPRRLSVVFCPHHILSYHVCNSFRYPYFIIVRHERICQVKEEFYRASARCIVFAAFPTFPPIICSVQKTDFRQTG